ncbi:hypothetical protein [Parapedobacter sp. DT-150]|uniref:hypothetical protein n=1 Tax=Parapedobacter sp. DT-150 TaxID=3396162 RepID=UPI003F1E2AAC
MRLIITPHMLSFILVPMFSCDQQPELFPRPCSCDIEVATLSAPSLITYRVAAGDGAEVSSITYQTNDGQVTAHDPVLPFAAAIELEKGQTVALAATGNPGKGNITLTYEAQGTHDTSSMLTSSTSRVWVLKDGICQ